MSIRQEHRLLTRSRIVAAARILFAASNYLSVAIDDIAQEAGVSRATFYLHFDSKEDVVRSILAEDLGRQDALFRKLADTPNPTLHDLKRWVVDYFNGFRRRQDSVRLFNFMMGLDPTYVPLFTEKRDAYLATLGERFEAFRLPPPGPLRDARRIEMHMLFYQIEQLAFHLAFESCTLRRDLAVQASAEALAGFMARHGPVSG